MSAPTYVVMHNDLPYDATYRMPALNESAPVYVTISQVWQEGHAHTIQDIGRDGAGACHTCGATAWSPMWVAQGYFGPSTLAWINDVLVIVRSIMDEQAEALVCDQLGAQVVLAAFDPKAKASTRRPGVPVPRMAYGVLSLSD